MKNRAVAVASVWLMIVGLVAGACGPEEATKSPRKTSHGEGKEAPSALMKLLRGGVVERPRRGTPEAVVYDVIESLIMFRKGDAAGDNKMKNDAWKQYRHYLHPDELNPVSLKNWKENKFLATVRKVHFFTAAEDDKSSVKDSKPTYEIAHIDEDDDGKRLKVYVVNEGNEESPTPCKLVLTDDGWRIRDMCL